MRTKAWRHGTSINRYGPSIEPRHKHAWITVLCVLNNSRQKNLDHAIAGALLSLNSDIWVKKVVVCTAPMTRLQANQETILLCLTTLHAAKELHEPMPAKGVNESRVYNRLSGCSLDYSISLPTRSNGKAWPPTFPVSGIKWCWGR